MASNKLSLKHPVITTVMGSLWPSAVNDTNRLRHVLFFSEQHPGSLQWQSLSCCCASRPHRLGETDSFEIWPQQKELSSKSLIITTITLKALPCPRCSGCKRYWEGAQPGELTPSGTRDIPLHLAYSPHKLKTVEDRGTRWPLGSWCLSSQITTMHDETLLSWRWWVIN